MTLAECCQEVAQRVDNPSESGYERFVGLEHLESGATSIRRWGSTEDVTSSMKLFKEGDVIVARRNVYLRRAGRADFDGVCSGDGIVLRATDHVCLPELLVFLLNTESFWDYVSSQADGTMSKRITVKRLLAYELALPPLSEQRRIADALGACVAAEGQLESLADGAAMLRQSFLNELFACADADAVVCGSLRGRPHWRSVRLPDLVVDQPNALTAGPFGTIFKAKDFRSSGVPIIQLRHLTEDGLRLDRLTYMDPAIYRKLHTPYTVMPGDLLITKMGEPPGLACIYPADAAPGMVTPDVIKATLDQQIIHPEFALALFNNTRSRANMMQLCKGGTRTRVSLDELYQLRWPLPPIEEQAAIVDQLRSFEFAMAAARSRSERLKQLRAHIAASIGGTNVR